MSEPSRPAALADIPPCDPATIRVAVLMGGNSAEREVSLMSGREVASGLRRAGFRVDEIDLMPDRVGDLAGRMMDVAFIALHGTFGEYGRLQKQLDDLGILYVGSDPEASHLAMDKVAAKEAFASAGIPTPPWRVVALGDEATADEAYAALGPSVVVKPVDEGSSVAVTLADSAKAFRRGLAEVFAIRDRALVERCIRGPELTVGVLHMQGLPVVEIVPHQAFYNYDAKYFDDATEYRIDPPLAAGVADEARRLAVASHRALGCRDFSRVDLMLAEDEGLWVIEVNTIPGFTTHSLLPKSASGAGIGFADLCRAIVELALVRRAAGAGQ
jgi:D-alanine-D-alanine ligase